MIDQGLGKFLPKDEHGCLVNDTAASKIYPDFMPIISEVSEIVIRLLGE